MNYVIMRNGLVLNCGTTKPVVTATDCTVNGAAFPLPVEIAVTSTPFPVDVTATQYTFADNTFTVYSTPAPPAPPQKPYGVIAPGDILPFFMLCGMTTTTINSSIADPDLQWIWKSLELLQNGLEYPIVDPSKRGFITKIALDAMNAKTYLTNPVYAAIRAAWPTVG